MVEKENGTGRINLPDFKLFYKPIVIKTVYFRYENRNIPQWNKIEINPCRDKCMKLWTTYL